MKPFAKSEFKHKTIYVMYDEHSLAQRRERAAGTAVFHQLQQMKLLTRWPLSMPTKKRKHYSGSNKGDCVGPVELDDWSKAWSATYEQKLEIYGRNHRIAVGGPTEDDDDEEEPDVVEETDQKPATNDRQNSNGQEPIFYHTLPCKFYEDLYTSYCLRHILHLTAGDGAAAKAAMKLRRGYFGICMTDQHTEQLYMHLTDWMLEQMSDSNSPYYQSDMKGDVDGTVKTEPSADPKPAKRNKTADPAAKGTKRKRKGGKHQKDKKKAASSSSSSSGSDSSDSGGSK